MGYLYVYLHTLLPERILPINSLHLQQGKADFLLASSHVSGVWPVISLGLILSKSSLLWLVSPSKKENIVLSIVIALYCKLYIDVFITQALSIFLSLSIPSNYIKYKKMAHSRGRNPTLNPVSTCRRFPLIE